MSNSFIQRVLPLKGGDSVHFYCNSCKKFFQAKTESSSLPLTPLNTVKTPRCPKCGSIKTVQVPIYP